MVLLEEANESKPHGPIPLISLLFIAVVVLPHRSDSKNKRKDYVKGERCYFCARYLTSRLSRHLKQVHGGEPLVAAAVAEKDEPARSRVFHKIQNLGNFVHNTNVSYHLILESN